MQEAEADSLGARRDRRLNNSNNSMNDSAKLKDGGGPPATTEARQHDGLLGYFERDREDEDDDICVFADNARGLPNRVAKSMPPIPFPPAAPESPRPIESKDGVIIKTPTHLPVKASSLPDGLGMPELGEMHLSDFDSAHTQMSMATDTDHDEEETETEAEDEDDVPMEEAAAAAKEEQQVVDEVPMESFTTAPAAGTPKRISVPAVPLDQRIFPKNQRRSHKGKRPSRSYSSGNRSSASGTDDDDDCGQSL